MKRCYEVVVASLILAISNAALAQTTLRAGAAKIDVTPSAGELPKNNLGVLDRLYARAMVLENGTTSVALITVDAGSIPDVLWQTVSGQIQKELGIPPARVLLTATHTHSAGGPRGSNYSQNIVQAVRLAKQNLAPARIGYGTGLSFINVNRQIIDPKTGRWWEGANYDGPSDKTVAVLKVEALEGSPIAVYYNYAVQPSSPANWIRSAPTSPVRSRGMSRIRSTIASSRCGRPAPPAIRIPSTISRPTTCARFGSRTTRRAASISATRCRLAARVSIEAIQQWPG